jgi:hypothetical protein
LAATFSGDFDGFVVAAGDGLVGTEEGHVAELGKSERGMGSVWGALFRNVRRAASADGGG